MVLLQDAEGAADGLVGQCLRKGHVMLFDTAWWAERVQRATEKIPSRLSLGERRFVVRQALSGPADDGVEPPVPMVPAA